jgi:hypothetical protein
MLPPQPLGDLLWRPVVVKFGGDQARQLRIRGQLAYFRTPRPLERSSVGGLHTLIAQYADDPGQVVVGIETDRGLWAGAAPSSQEATLTHSPGHPWSSH